MLSLPLGLEASFSGSALTRRQVLQVGGLSMLGLGLPGAVGARESGYQATTSEKSCIFVVLGGGPSHVDLWDLKPEAAAEIRGPYKPIASAVPGVHLNELQPRLARLSRHFTLIRSMTHSASIRNHPDAMHNVLCGQGKALDDARDVPASVRARSPASRSWTCSAKEARSRGVFPPWWPSGRGQTRPRPTSFVSYPPVRPPEPALEVILSCLGLQLLLKLPCLAKVACRPIQPMTEQNCPRFGPKRAEGDQTGVRRAKLPPRYRPGARR